MKQFIRYLVYDPSTLTDDLLQDRLDRALDPETAEFMPLRLAQHAADHRTVA